MWAWNHSYPTLLNPPTSYQFLEEFCLDHAAMQFKCFLLVLVEQGDRESKVGEQTKNE